MEPSRILVADRSESLANTAQHASGVMHHPVEIVTCSRVAEVPEMVTQHAATIDGQPVSDLRVLDTTPLLYALVNSIKTLVARIEVLEAAQAPT